jgi:hypothetical protein
MKTDFFSCHYLTTRMTAALHPVCFVRQAHVTLGKDFLIVTGRHFLLVILFSNRRRRDGVGGGWSGPSIVVSRIAFARIWFQRRGDSNAVQTLITTADGYPLDKHPCGLRRSIPWPGANYHLAPARAATNVDVPIIDNGLLRVYDFSLSDRSVVEFRYRLDDRRYRVAFDGDLVRARHFARSPFTALRLMAGFYVVACAHVAVERLAEVAAQRLLRQLAPLKYLQVLTDRMILHCSQRSISKIAPVLST